jgi:hypothetical protein
MRTRKLALLLAFFATLARAGDKGFSPPPATHAKTFPLVETHDDEKVSIAVDPYDRPPKSSLFRVNYGGNGFLVLRLMISNDGTKPLMMDSLKINYVTGRREKLEPATTDDVVRHLSHPSRPDMGTRVPLPIPTSRNPHGVNKEVLEEVQSANFLAVPVTPGSTHSGFLFFNVRDLDSPKAGAHLYVSGIKAGTQELFYFDIPLDEPSTPARNPSDHQ